MTPSTASPALVSGSVAVEIALIVHAICPHCQAEIRFALHTGNFTVRQGTYHWLLQCPACVGAPFYVRVYQRSLTKPLRRAIEVADQQRLARAWEHTLHAFPA